MPLRHQCSSYERKKMEEYNFQLVEKINQQVHVVQVPDTCSFWMIRTKSGAYYSEYIHNGYIAIG